MRVQFWGTRGSIAKPGPSMPVVAQIGAEHKILEHAELREKAPAFGAMANAAADHIVGWQPFERHALLSYPTSAGASDIGSFLLCRVQAFF